MNHLRDKPARDFFSSLLGDANTMEAGFCVEALEETLGRHGKPDIFNTDQGALPGRRPHSSLDRETQDQACFNRLPQPAAA